MSNKLYTKHELDAWLFKAATDGAPSISIAFHRNGVSAKPHEHEEVNKVMNVMEWFHQVNVNDLQTQHGHLMTVVDSLDPDSDLRNSLESIEAMLSSLLTACDDIEDAKQNAKKDEVEKIIIRKLSNIGVDVPSNIEDITQYVFEDVMETSDYPNFNDSDVVIGLRRYLEKDVK